MRPILYGRIPFFKKPYEMYLFRKAQQKHLVGQDIFFFFFEALKSCFSKFGAPSINSHITMLFSFIVSMEIVPLLTDFHAWI